MEFHANMAEPMAVLGIIWGSAVPRCAQCQTCQHPSRTCRPSNQCQRHGKNQTTSAAANVANGEPFGALHWINIAAVSWGCAFRTISLLVIFNTMPFALCCGSELIADKNMKSSVFFSTSALHSF